MEFQQTHDAGFPVGVIVARMARPGSFSPAQIKIMTRVDLEANPTSDCGAANN
jgi:hypothetical protein